jgi:hypothetical protein
MRDRRQPFILSEKAPANTISNRDFHPADLEFHDVHPDRAAPTVCPPPRLDLPLQQMSQKSCQLAPKGAHFTPPQITDILRQIIPVKPLNSPFLQDARLLKRPSNNRVHKGFREDSNWASRGRALVWFAFLNSRGVRQAIISFVSLRGRLSLLPRMI